LLSCGAYSGIYKARKMSSFAVVRSKTKRITARLMMEKKEFLARMFVSIAKTGDDPREYKFIKGLQCKRMDPPNCY
jgi:hypothetical protein